MKTLILAASLLALTSTAMGADVGVSINVGQPGFYGRIDIGQFPQPQVIYAQPVLIERPVRYVERQPVYLRVPPGHAKHWAKHCRAYNACGQQVYFVQDSWYNNEYAPRYRAQHLDRNDHDRDERRDDYDKNDKHNKHDKHDKHDKYDKYDKHDKRDKHGNGNGNGNGHNKD